MEGCIVEGEVEAEGLQRESHLAAGMASASLLTLLYSSNPSLQALAVLIGGLSSLIPDLDLRWRHRMLLHNLTTAATLTAAFWLLWSSLSLPDSSLAAGAFAAGYLSHILLDMLTVRGVALLYPYSRRRYRILRLRTSDKTANTLVTIASTALLAAALSHSLLNP